jgi:hypothetical protein
LRLLALSAFAIILVACSNSSSPNTTSSASRTSTPPSAVNPAGTKAADLRTHLDLLLGEQVLLVAKQSAAAVNHSDSYAGYTTLLTTNGADLANVVRSAFGNAAADQLSQTWRIENGYLVDYTIGVVTHNQNKADGAMSGLVNGFVPQFAQLIMSLTQLPLDPITQLLSQQVLEDKAVIDDQAAQKPGSTFPDLHTAYAQSSRLGDALAPRMAQKFSDKFPGDAALRAVDHRVSLNMLLQEHAYLATMATEAIVRGSGSEKSAAATALAANADSLGTAFSDLFGNAAGTRFDVVWAARDAALVGYAIAGDDASKQALAQSFVSQFIALAHVAATPVVDQVDATIKVIDDQRSKSAAASLPADDRAAAGGMESIADSVVDSAPQG